MIYLRRRVIVIILLGFVAGLPLSLTGTTLAVWMQENGVKLSTIGLFGLVGVPYSLKFLWAPIFDAYRVPLLAKLLGRRRGWLLPLQLGLAAAIWSMAGIDPGKTPLLMAVAAITVSVFSASQDIVIDALRIETLAEEEQAAGMAGYVAAYRLALLASSAGIIALSDYLETLGMSLDVAWAWSYRLAAMLILVGIGASLFARETPLSVTAVIQDGSPIGRFFKLTRVALADFAKQRAVIAILAFVILFKLCDSLAGILTAPFVLDLGYDKLSYAGIVKGVGTGAVLIGGFLGGWLALRLPLVSCLWLSGFLQMFSNLAFSVLAVIGVNYTALSTVIVIENLAGGIGTVIFVAYISSLCKSPLHTATQFALLSALASLGRTTLPSVSGFIAEETGWFWFFILTALAALPGLALLAYLQIKGHFTQTDEPKAAAVP